MKRQEDAAQSDKRSSIQQRKETFRLLYVLFFAALVNSPFRLWKEYWNQFHEAISFLKLKYNNTKFIIKMFTLLLRCQIIARNWQFSTEAYTTDYLLLTTIYNLMFPFLLLLHTTLNLVTRYINSVRNQNKSRY